MPKKKQKWMGIFSDTLRHFLADDGFTLAAALSFYAILSLLPLSMIVVSILGYFLGESKTVIDSILQLVSDTIPYLSPTFLKNLSGLIQQKLTGGWVGVIALFLVASLLFNNLEKVLDKIFESTRKRNFFHSKLLSVFFIFLIALLMFVPSVLKNIDGLFLFLNIPISLGQLNQGSFFFFMIAWSGFVMVLALVPKHEVNFKLNALGGLLFAFLLFLARFAFKWYIALSLERLHLLYGSLTAIILIILWIYYLMSLFILCAEFVGNLQSSFQK